MLLLAAAYSIILILEFVDITNRLKEITDEAACRTLIDLRKNILKIGLLGLIASWLNYCLWDVFDTTFGILSVLRGFTPIITIISGIIIIILWIVSPSQKFIKDQERVHENQLLLKEQLKKYTISKSFRVNDYIIGIDKLQKTIIMYNTNEDKKITAIPFDSIVECEIMQDSSTILKSGLNRAVVGGMIAGVDGAIIGAMTRKSSDVVYNLSVRIITNNLAHSLYIIEIINTTIQRNTDEYKKKFQQAQDLYSTIVAIINSK